MMEDRDGRKLRVHLAELRGNRRVFEAFLSGFVKPLHRPHPQQGNRDGARGATLDC
jgi:hypothetical protein